MLQWPIMLIDARKQHFSCQPSQFIQVLADGCQVHVFCHINIVKANNGEIAWNLILNLRATFITLKA